MMHLSNASIFRVILLMTLLIAREFCSALRCRRILKSDSLYIPVNSHRDDSQDCRDGVEDRCLRAQVVTDTLGFLNINMTIGYCASRGRCEDLTCGDLHNMTTDLFTSHHLASHQFSECTITCCASDHCNREEEEEEPAPPEATAKSTAATTTTTKEKQTTSRGDSGGANSNRSSAATVLLLLASLAFVICF